ncbi:MULTISPECIES: flagellin hook IN motif-containing protein [unclassified Methylobacterium]|uniref:flagellin hook IN motif-containing protein n=1 Tax=unclassified Methylobacterium TaxID=2615210 RepID=UPI0036FEA38E
MSSSITLSAATRQNLLSLQDTASLLATTQSRLSTGKKVNSALDNPINFFTASNLSARSTELSSLLDGISNGVQTIQAANTGLSKLQNLTSQLKSTAQQALAATSAFTSKAASVSTGLAGATAANLLSTGPTAAVSDKAVGTLTNGQPSAAVPATVAGSVDYKPTAAPATMRGTPFTATTPTLAQATGASTFSAPANAVAGTATGGAFTTLTSAATIEVTYATSPTSTTTTSISLAIGDTVDAAVTKLNDGLNSLGITARNDGGKLSLTGKTDGSAFSVKTTAQEATETGFTTGTGTPSSGNIPAAVQTLTIGTEAIEIKGGSAGASAADVTKAALDAINARTTATGVTAGLETVSGSQRLVLTGKADGSNFTVTGEAGNSLGFASAPTTTANGAAAASQTLTIGGTQITIAGGGSIDDAVAAINRQTGTTGVSAAKDPADATRLLLTGKSDGSAFTVASSNPASSGFSATPTSTSLAATVSGAYTPTGTPAAATGASAFTGPANAVAGTVTGDAYTPTSAAVTIAIASTGSTTTNISVSLAANDTLETAISKINTAGSAAGITAAIDATNKIKITGKSNGDALSITGTGAGFSATALTAARTEAKTQTLTLGSPGTTSTTSITISGGNAGDSAASVLAGALKAINDQSSATGVTASSSADGKIVLKGASSGAAFTVQGGANNTLGFSTSKQTVENGVAPSAQTLTINGKDIAIAAGASQAAVITAINNANTGPAATGVSAGVDPDNAGKIRLTGKVDGSAFTVQSSNAASSGFSGITQQINNNQGAAQTVTVNGTAIEIAASATLDQAIATINAKSATTGVTAGKDTAGTKLTFTGSADGFAFTIKGSEHNTLGLASTEASVAGTFDPGQTTLVSTLGFRGGDSFSVNGQTVNLTATDTIGSLVQKVGAATNGAVTASYDAATNKFSFTAADSRTAVQLGDGSTATGKVAHLGFTATDFAAGSGAPSSQSALAGKSITVQVGSGAGMNTATITFGTAPGQVSTLAQLNEALAPANAQATIDSLTGKISITTANDVGAQNLSIVATGTGNPFTTGSATANLGGDGLSARNNLVQTYNDLLKQMDQLASDAGFNGVNLLSGDNLTINFNEKGTSSLKVQGSATSAASLGLSAVGQTNFQESSAIKKIVDQINSAGSQLQSRAAALGANLAVVQNRQDFTKQIVTVLDTGAANLTSADLNEEAANSQALSTRNSLAISALSLANQSQQGILQLLR